MIVTHDAEDLIHPEELRWINYYSARFDFIQTPVLALPTPFWEFTHGVYCDEFAEYHTRDMTVRPISGGFVPKLWSRYGVSPRCTPNGLAPCSLQTRSLIRRL